VISSAEDYSTYASSVSSFEYSSPGLVQNNEGANYTSGSISLSSNTGIKWLNITGQLQSRAESPGSTTVEFSTDGDWTSHSITFDSTSLQTKSIDLSSSSHSGNIQYISLAPPGTDFTNFGEISVELQQ
jgi:hypothetical protein